MANTKDTTDSKAPPKGGPPAPSDSGEGMGSGFEQMLGGGPDSIYPRDPDKPFIIGGGLTSDQASGSLGETADTASTGNGATDALTADNSTTDQPNQDTQSKRQRHPARDKRSSPER